MPQKWALGYQQSRWGYSVSQKQVEKIAENLRKYDLPCDVLHFDIDYMDGYRVFTWRKDTYEKPADFIKKMRKLGFRIITIIDPGVKKDDDYKIYQEGIKKATSLRRQMVRFTLTRFGQEMPSSQTLAVKKCVSGGLRTAGI